MDIGHHMLLIVVLLFHKHLQVVGTTGTNFSVIIGARTWRVVHGCVAGTETANSIYLTSSGVCDCGGGTTYTVRPMIKNANWGGLNGSSCGQPTQTITVTFS